MVGLFRCIFFFSSRRRHTRLQGDWSSDVCSSDLPLHVAISSQWKIHYFTAEMAERADHRAEDAEFLENMPGVLGPRATGALAQIQATLGLDYAGIDFGLSSAGDLLLFEANATMVVNPPEPDERWAYRRQAVERIFAAVRRMLLWGRL